jgi:hypothetical protein
VKDRNCRYLISIGIVFFGVVFFCKLSYAYIDPGTSSVIFSTLAYILTGIAVVFSLLIAPVRMFYRFLKRKFMGVKDPKDG